MSGEVSSREVRPHPSHPEELCHSYEAAKVWCETKFGFNCGATLVFDRDLSGGDKKRFTCSKCRGFCLFLRLSVKHKTRKWRICTKTSVLNHHSINEKGLMEPCIGELTRTASQLEDNALMNAIVDKGLQIDHVKAIALSQGITVSDATVKNYVYNHKIHDTEIIGSLNEIEPYLFTLQELNPGTVYRIDRLPGTNQFQRLLFIPHYTKGIINDDYIYIILSVLMVPI